MSSSVLTVTLNPALDKTVTIADLQVGGLNRVRQMRVDPGGKGINVAKVLVKFGINVTAAGIIAGSQGRLLQKQLEKEGIQTAFEEVPGEVRTNLKIYDEQTKRTTEINEPGFHVGTQELWSFRTQLQRLLASSQILVVGGSLPLGVPEDIYREYIQMANEMGVNTILDADGVPFQAGMKAVPYAVKPNLFELEQWMGCQLETESEIVSAGQELIKMGISLVAISMGSKGAIVMDKTEVYKVTPFPIAPKSTVGAGDSMVAAIAYSLLERKSLSELAILATAAGTVTASKSGTQVCTLAEVQNSVSKVHAAKIEIL